MYTESDLVIAVTIPGKGRAWERSSVNGWVHFLFWGESQSAGGILSLPTTKARGHYSDCRPHPYQSGQNTVMLALPLS